MKQQSKDINPLPILNHLANIQALGCTGSLYPNMENSISPGFPENTPPKLILSKMKKLVKQGLVDGCSCGCRGDFVLTKKGLEVLENYTENGIE